MPNIFQTRSGDPLPSLASLMAVSDGVTMAARGEDISSPELLEKLVRKPHSRLIEEFRALNNRVLRAIVDCLVRGDEISRAACQSLAALSLSTHEHYAGSGSFVLANLLQAKHRGFAPLNDILTELNWDPDAASRRATAQLRFSRFPPEAMMGEHPLLEDALARATVECLTSKPPALGAAERFARLAFAFRSAPGDVLPRRDPPPAVKVLAENRAELIRSSIAPLVHDARRLEQVARRREEHNDLRVLTPLTHCLETTYNIFSARTPWRPLSFFVRAEWLSAFEDICSPRLCKSFDMIAPMFEELKARRDLLDHPGTGTLDSFGQALLLAADPTILTVPASALEGMEVDLLPDTHSTIAGLKRLFRLD